METIYFILFIVACVGVIFWAATRSKAKEKELSAVRENRRKKVDSEKLVTPADTIFSHKNQIWQKRRQHASDNYGSAPMFVPKSAAEKEPQYDGFSRRDRHHLQPDVHIKKESHDEELQMGYIEVETDQKETSTPKRTN